MKHGVVKLTGQLCPFPKIGNESQERICLNVERKWLGDGECAQNLSAPLILTEPIVDDTPFILDVNLNSHSIGPIIHHISHCIPQNPGVMHGREKPVMNFRLIGAIGVAAFAVRGLRLMSSSSRRSSHQDTTPGFVFNLDYPVNCWAEQSEHDTRDAAVFLRGFDKNIDGQVNVQIAVRESAVNGSCLVRK